MTSEHKNNNRETLIIILHTNGGSSETTEKYVNIVRRYYKRVYFIVPNMDCSSCLGPIDPQIYSIKEKRFVPANGYIDEIGNIIKKSQDGTLTNAEFAMYQMQDLAFLNQCKQTKELTINLLEEWLVKYKFCDWKETQTRKIAVNEEYKRERAKEIASQLGDNTKWHIHSRPIMLPDLERIKIEIDDYTDIEDLKKIIRQYTDFILHYLATLGFQNSRFIHTRLFV